MFPAGTLRFAFPAVLILPVLLVLPAVLLLPVFICNSPREAAPESQTTQNGPDILPPLGVWGTPGTPVWGTSGGSPVSRKTVQNKN